MISTAFQKCLIQYTHNLLYVGNKSYLYHLISTICIKEFRFIQLLVSNTELITDAQLEYLEGWVYTSCITRCQRLKTYDIKKLRNIRKISKLHRIIVSCSVFLLKWYFFNTWKRLFKNRNWTFLPVVPYLTWNLEFVSNILPMI